MSHYRPRQWNEIEDGPVSMMNEPITNAVPLRPVQNVRSIHAVLVENLANTRALLRRLEAGVGVPSHGRRGRRGKDNGKLGGPARASGAR